MAGGRERRSRRAESRGWVRGWGDGGMERAPCSEGFIVVGILVEPVLHHGRTDLL
jgi:hypothetical protein